MQFILLTVVTICSGSFVVTIFCDLWLTQNEAFPICLQCFRIYLNKLPYWGTKCTTDRCNGFFLEVVTQCSNTKQDRYFTAIFMKTSCIFGNILVGYSSQINSQKNFQRPGPTPHTVGHTPGDIQNCQLKKLWHDQILIYFDFSWSC